MQIGGRFWTLSNIISLSRVFVVLPGIWWLFQTGEHARLWATLWFVLAALTDAVDGMIARWLNQVSEWGKVIDPFADKVSVALAVVALYVTGDIPLWFLILLVFRDVAIFIAATLMTARLQTIPVSSWVGKVAVTVMGITLIFATLQWEAGLQWGMVISTIFVVASLIDYAKRMMAALR
ncbi:MAG: CDP-alcohol phosphatidyltransferase family protein [Bacteroidetes bacterium]|nr:CDP-alcohol phosphatidyltransferase family protein [Bacteroidota bacterium]